MLKIEKLRLWFGTTCLVLGASIFWAFFAAVGLNLLLHLSEREALLFLFLPVFLLTFIIGMRHYLRTSQNGVPIVLRRQNPESTRKHVPAWVALLLMAIPLVVIFVFG